MSVATSLRINIASLGALQIFNFALTLSTLPYLARVLGVAGWGQVVFVQMVINYLIWVANWGFYLGATKRIASERADKESLSRIFVTTWVAQWCLTGLLAAVFLIGLKVVPLFAGNELLYLAGAGLLLANALTPFWYLNGLEKVRESALIQMVVKILALPLIFTLVDEESDMVTYLVINSICAIVVGLFTLMWIFRSGRIYWRIPQLSDVYAAVAQEYRLFTSSLLASLNGALVPTVLGVLGGSAELGWYNLADRARSAAITILHPITHALFPRMCHLFSNNRVAALDLLKRSGMGILALSIVISLTLMLFPSEILRILGGKEFRSGGRVLAWLAFTPVLTTIASFIIHQILIPTGVEQGYSKVVHRSLLLSAVLVVPAVTTLGAEGAAIVSLCAELFAAAYLILYVWQHKLLTASIQSSGARN